VLVTVESPLSEIAVGSAVVSYSAKTSVLTTLKPNEKAATEAAVKNNLRDFHFKIFTLFPSKNVLIITCILMFSTYQFAFFDTLERNFTNIFVFFKNENSI
jgi:hypothetical protein